MSPEGATSEPPQTPFPVSAWRGQQGLWILCAVISSLFFLLAGSLFFNEKLFFSMELAVSQALQAITWPGFVLTMKVVSWPAEKPLPFVTLVGVACLILMIGRARCATVILLGLVLVGQTIKVGVKHLVHRPRPADMDGVIPLPDVFEEFSFPSGHVVLYTVFFGFLCYITITRIKTRGLRWPLSCLLSFMVLAVSISRLYLGAHWLGDVLGGYLLGGALLAAGIGLDQSLALEKPSFTRSR